MYEYYYIFNEETLSMHGYCHIFNEGIAWLKHGYYYLLREHGQIHGARLSPCIIDGIRFIVIYLIQLLAQLNIIRLSA